MADCGLLSAEYPMISVCPPRLTSGPQPAHDAATPPLQGIHATTPRGARAARRQDLDNVARRVFMQQRRSVPATRVARAPAVKPTVETAFGQFNRNRSASRTSRVVSA